MDADLLIPAIVLSSTQFQERNNLTLEVNITSMGAKYIVRNLNWYLNGNPIGNTSNSNGNNTLVTDGTAGEYEARYDGLLLNNPYNETCEKMILENSRHLPLFKPVKFLVDVKGSC